MTSTFPQRTNQVIGLAGNRLVRTTTVITESAA